MAGASHFKSASHNLSVTAVTFRRAYLNKQRMPSSSLPLPLHLHLHLIGPRVTPTLRLVASASSSSSSSSSSSPSSCAICTVEPAAPHSTLLEVKKSRFIANVVPCEDDMDKAMHTVQSIKAQYADARHNCFAVVTRSGGHRMSDDGEPSGTAGKPILNAILGSGMVNCVVVVTRYYGGIKLGTGGLARAYGGAAVEALAQTERKEVIAMTTAKVMCAYDDVGVVYRVAGTFEGVVEMTTDEEIASKGEASLSVQVSASRAGDFAQALCDSTSGRAHVELN
mmetsp:Transcript_3192/g.8618  ORF Transcript_3192/g.8618 Transcript_3192/m.8618 type:complete len:281 (+) Transcript_3192:32-874(+)